MRHLHPTTMKLLPLASIGLNLSGSQCDGPPTLQERGTEEVREGMKGKEVSELMVPIQSGMPPLDATLTGDR